MDFFTGYEGINCGFDDAALCGFGIGSFWARRNHFSGTQYPNHFLATHTDAGKDHDTEIYSLVRVIARAMGLIFQSTSLMLIVPYIRNSIS